MSDTLAARVAARLREIPDQAEVFGLCADLVEAHGRYVTAWNDLSVPGGDGDQALIDANRALAALADALGVEA